MVRVVVSRIDRRMKHTHLIDFIGLNRGEQRYREAQKEDRHQEYGSVHVCIHAEFLFQEHGGLTEEGWSEMRVSKFHSLRRPIVLFVHFDFLERIRSGEREEGQPEENED